MPFDSAEFNERLFFPRKDVTPPPPGAVDHEVSVPNARLHLRVHAAQSARATVLFFHGNGELVAHYDELAASFAAAGASLAIVDYRGYGASTGIPTLRTVIADAPRVLAKTREIAPDEPIVVMGRSLGGASVAELYQHSPDVAAFVLESAFSDLAAFVRRRGVPVPPAFDEDDLATFDPLPKLARGTKPLLVLHGEEDTMVVPAEGKVAFDAAGTSDKELVLVPGHGHNDIAAALLYWRALAAFVARVTAR